MRRYIALLLLLITNTCMAQENGTVKWDVTGTAVNLYFDLGSAALTPATKTTLDSLMYNDVVYKGRRVSLIGYADMTGEEAANKTLSYKRAKAIANYLHSMGVDTADIDYVTGLGEITRKNNTPQAIDRKVTMIIAQPPAPPTIKWEDTGRLVATVYFQFGNADMQYQSKPVVDTVTAILKRKPNMRVKLDGYVCCKSFGAVKYISTKANDPKYDEYLGQVADSLSLQRAKLVYGIMKRNGVDTARMRYAGKGFKSISCNKIHANRVEVRAVSE
ncbi:MAG TPA: OmpA family protein [Flavipsychrobacter sp.]|nr:OmpA family protein [Flavipsychrobacter sp.]